MEFEMIKSSAEDHIDIMTMMMQMEKFPEFCGPYQDTSTMPEIEFSCGNTTTIGTTSSIFQNPNVASPTLINQPSSIPFLGNPNQEPLSTVPPLQHNVTTGRFKSTAGALPQANTFPSPLEKRNSMAAMREIIYRIAAMQPIHIDPESVKPPKRRNVKISKDPQSVAARHRRERISERIRILQRLVPGGTKMDTASMLDEAIHYVKFLKKQVQTLEQVAANRPMGVGFPATIMENLNYSSLVKACQSSQMVGSMQMLR